MNKRGISAIVATVLIILITVAAVTIIWVAIIPMIQNQIAFSNLEGQVIIVSSEGYTFYSLEKNIISVHLRRSADEEEMPYVNVVLTFGGNSVSTIVLAPEPNQEKVYQFDASNFDQELDSVSVSPIFIVGNKKYEGSITSSLQVSGTWVSSESLVVKNVFIPGVDYSEIDLLDGLVSWWRFEGNVVDSIGENDGTNYGVTFDDGVGAFDGENNYINVTSSDGSLNADFSEFSFSVWVKPSFNQLDPSHHRVFDKINSTVHSFRALFVFSVDDWRFKTTTTDGSVSCDTLGLTWAANTWHHFAGTYDGTNMKVYWDSDLENTCAQTGSIVNVVDNFLIGTDSFLGAPFNGSIDNVVIFNKVLTLKEIIAIYNNQKK